MDFEKIFKESLPVEERDAYNAWKKEQDEKAKNASQDRANALRQRKMDKNAEEFAYWAGQFFGRSCDAYTDDGYIFVKLNPGARFQIGFATLSGEICFDPEFEDVFNSFKNVECEFDKNYRTAKVRIFGKRENVGPLFGKLKKIDMAVSRDVAQITNAQGFNTNNLIVTFDAKEFIKMAQQGLRIFDFIEAGYKG
jgi:hypothetical protein